MRQLSNQTSPPATPASKPTCAEVTPLSKPTYAEVIVNQPEPQPAGDT